MDFPIQSRSTIYAILNPPEPDPSLSRDALREMLSLVEQLRGAGRDLCGKYLKARESALLIQTKGDILRKLNGTSLDWDNIDPYSLTKMVDCLILTCRKMGELIEAVGWGLARLQSASQLFMKVKSNTMANAWNLCNSVRPLLEKLDQEHDVVTAMVDVVTVESGQGILYQLHWGDEGGGMLWRN